LSGNFIKLSDKSEGKRFSRVKQPIQAFNLNSSRCRERDAGRQKQLQETG